MAHSITNIDNFSSDNELFWKVLKKKKKRLTEEKPVKCQLSVQ